MICCVKVILLFAIWTGLLKILPFFRCIHHPVVLLEVVAHRIIDRNVFSIGLGNVPPQRRRFRRSLILAFLNLLNWMLHSDWPLLVHFA